MRAPRRATPYRRASEGAVWRFSVALGLALVSATASAQVSGSVSVVSNYRFRGLSLSEDKPAAQLGIAYDDPLGWYAGAFASSVEFATPVGRQLQAVPYLGYAQRTASGASWEVGANYSAFTGNARGYNYPEAYLGVASGNVSGRLYYSSRYFGQNSTTVYGEVNATRPLFGGLRLLVHVGVLWSDHTSPYLGQPERVFDGRVGLGIDFDQVSAQLSWVGISSADAAYGGSSSRSRNGPVLTLLRPF